MHYNNNMIAQLHHRNLEDGQFIIRVGQAYITGTVNAIEYREERDVLPTVKMEGTIRK